MRNPSNSARKLRQLLGLDPGFLPDSCELQYGTQKPCRGESDRVRGSQPVPGSATGTARSFAGSRGRWVGALLLAALIPVALVVHPCPAGATPPPDASDQLQSQLEAEFAIIDAQLRAGQHAAALVRLDRLLQRLRGRVPADDPALAVAHAAAAQACAGLHKWAEAREHGKKAVAIAERGEGPNPASAMMVSAIVAAAAQQLAAYDEAIDWWERTLACAVRGSPTPEFLVAVFDAMLDCEKHRSMNLAKLRAILDRKQGVLRYWASAPAEAWASCWVELAGVAMLADDLGAAEKDLGEATAVLAKAAAGPRRDRAMAQVLRFRAMLARANADYPKAERDLREGLALLHATAATDSADFVALSCEWATVLRLMGRLADADRALHAAGDGFTAELRGSVFEQIFLDESATLALVRGDLKGAVKARRASLAVTSHLVGAHHLMVSVARAELGWLEFRAGDRAVGERNLRAGLEGIGQSAGTRPTLAAQLVGHLCEVERLTGKAAAAIPRCQQALEWSREAFGSDSANAAPARLSLAKAQLSLGKNDSAVSEFRAYVALQERQIQRLLAVGSEADKRAFLAEARADVVMALALALQRLPGQPEVAELAGELVLQRKGRLFDAQRDQARLLQGSVTPEVRDLQAKLQVLRSRTATAALDARGDRQAVLAMAEEIREIERKLADALLRGEGAAPTATLAGLRAALPEHYVLIEYMLWRPWQDDPNGVLEGMGPQRLAALTVQRGAPTRAVDLGPWQPVADLVPRWRAALADPRRQDVDALGRKLDALILAPLRAQLPADATLVVAPDAALHLLPFDALVGEDGRYMVETRPILRVAAGRELIENAVPRPPRQRAVVLANPDFDAALLGSGDAAPRRSNDANSLQFRPLPGAEAEGRAVAALLAESQLWIGRAASESALKAVVAPQVLHLATHGFFLPSQAEAMGPATTPENPLLQSGLALTGSNAKAQTGEDGLLTALEASGLNLAGTQLVVLSACETGVGNLQWGDGVQGLQRAFGLAGARSVVMSLWKVDDEATRDLMTGMYAHLVAGRGVAEALRTAKLNLAHGRPGSAGVARSSEPLLPSGDQGPELRLRHPYFWAAFQATGDWRPVPGLARP